MQVWLKNKTNGYRIIHNHGLKHRTAQDLSISPYHILHQEARLGIPQGSACSSIIGAYCTSRLPWVAKVDVAMLNYADDYLLLAKSSNARAKAIDELTEAVGNLPGGTFKFSHKHESTAVYGITFLGHVLQVVDGKLTAWPCDGGNGLYRELGNFGCSTRKARLPGWSVRKVQ